MSFLFFFSSRRRHTRYWRDWSSDVCSSDLGASAVGGDIAQVLIQNRLVGARNRMTGGRPVDQVGRLGMQNRATVVQEQSTGQIGRASCRERVKSSEVAAS